MRGSFFGNNQLKIRYRKTRPARQLQVSLACFLGGGMDGDFINQLLPREVGLTCWHRAFCTYIKEINCTVTTTVVHQYNLTVRPLRQRQRHYATRGLAFFGQSEGKSPPVQEQEQERGDRPIDLSNGSQRDRMA